MNLLPARPPRVTFLTFNAYGIGGIARSVINVANELSTTHDVEILSMLRSHPSSTFPIDPRVRVVTLFDATRGKRRWRRRHPRKPRARAAARPARTPVLGREPNLNALAERRLRRRLATTETDVVISTRPSLHWAGAEMVRSHVPVIGWDHLNFETRYDNSSMGQLLDDVIPRLDAWVTLTEGDRDDYQRRLGHQAPRIEVIRNSSGWVAPTERPPRDSKVVVGGGRLHPRKGFDRAIEAWRPIAQSHPDWQLHIYGSGPSAQELQDQIDGAQLQEHVRLMGYTNDFQRVLADAELFLMTSHAEGFPMVLVEAMSQGTPIVSFDCPRGPAEIVRSGSTGQIVPNDDVPGLSAALATLLEDPVLRQRMGEQAMADSREYQLDVVADRWRALLDDVARPRAALRTLRRGRTRLRSLARRDG